jgi:hypothetical protein
MVGWKKSIVEIGFVFFSPLQRYSNVYVVLDHEFVIVARMVNATKLETLVLEWSLHFLSAILRVDDMQIVRNDSIC